MSAIFYIWILIEKLLKDYRKKSATFLKYYQKIFEIADQISEFLHQAKLLRYIFIYFYLGLSWSLGLLKVRLQGIILLKHM